MIADRRATAWLRQAERDLAHARRSAELGDPEWACNAAQQCAEKALKAALIDQGTRPPSVHDLMALARRLVQSGVMEAGTLASLGDLSALTEYSITARYPLGDGLTAPGDAISPRRVDEAVETAGRVLDWARAVLGETGA
ncbi:HEPN domain-containing protein [Roseospira navarrensis]|uniref:HEPN domain-containing protein n=1 Tax=Roseospira navarrensis TaxID=140058 RepID=A0A7X1ZES1_9PROT|nr:HEPN domain-containing protein [Roseospira navarrensis]MQX36256.1 HEPN domain-containing protein [Roseospira navarrensis]